MPKVKAAPTKPTYRMPELPSVLAVVSDLALPELPASDQFDETWHRDYLVMESGVIVHDPYDQPRLWETCMADIPSHDCAMRNAWTPWMVYDNPAFVEKHGKVAYMACYHFFEVRGKRGWKACATDRDYNSIELFNLPLQKVVDFFRDNLGWSV